MCPTVRLHNFILCLVCLLILLISETTSTPRSSFRKNGPPGGGPIPYPSMEMYKQSRLCPDQTNDWGPPYRYYRPTKKCYLVGERGPCGELMTFTLQNDDYGYCDCDQSLRCGRPLLYWPHTKRCYFVNDQGPCTPGKWLVFGVNNHALCRKNTCIAQAAMLPNRGIQFWFEHKGKCYRTGTRGYCPDTSKQILTNDWDKHRPTCSDDEVPDCGPVEYVHRMKCLPGMKMDYYESCTTRKITQESESESEEDAFVENTKKKNRVKKREPNIYHLKLE